MTATRPVSVVIPTIGRPALLRECLASIAACDPRPDEILVVDQSGDTDGLASVAEGGPSGQLRVVRCTGRGIARAMNLGLRSTRHGVVLVTHDDCTVAPDWVEMAWQQMTATTGTIVTGRVLPAGDPAMTPSTRTDREAREYTGEPTYGLLYPANMALDRLAVEAVGGFDERDGFEMAAEDNDLCYRWLKAGRCIRYEPAMVVWHHDWRMPEQLARTFVQYARGQGAFYAKHLYEGDRRMVGYVTGDLKAGLWATVVGIVHLRPRWTDERRGILRGLPGGLVTGWLEARRLARPERSGADHRRRRR
jgi:GT2 family glycosyltransferase